MENSKFAFLQCPFEIQWAILQRCDTVTLNNLLMVSRDMNAVVKQIIADKLRYLLGPPKIYQCRSSSDTDSRRLIGVSYSPLDNESAKHVLEFNYIGSNDILKFGDITDAAYSSCPTSTVGSAACSDFGDDSDDTDFGSISTLGSINTNLTDLSDVSENTKISDLNPKSKFAVYTSDDDEIECCATLDIGEADYYGQVILRFGLDLSAYGSRPIWMMELSQRIDSGWCDEESYVVRNKSVTYTVQVKKCNEESILNDFGELVNRYKVIISEIVFNSGFLLQKIEKATGVVLAC